MSDPSIAEFNSRIARIEKARTKGFGFEAEGTLGRSFYQRGQRRSGLRVPLVRPIVLLLVFGTLLKAVFLQQLGTDAYDARVAGLLQGQGFDRIGGWLMQADPVTRAAATQLGAFARLGD